MSLMSNKLFRMAAAPALALGALSSTVPFNAAIAQERPAAAQLVAANTNVAVSTTTPQVQYVDVSRYSAGYAREAAGAASHDGIAIVVWGGNRTIQQEAYNAARDLAGIGIRTAFVLAPDDNGLDGDAALQVYAASTPRSDGRMGTNNAQYIRTDMRDAGLRAYREAFPAQAIALGLVPTP
jgi:hypothetical protein